jgi:DNA modification methylase
MSKKKDTRRPWPADNVQRMKVADLAPYARNARTHSPEQVGQIEQSIRERGWTVPCLVDETGMIIAGHGRVMAAENMGIDEVPVMVAGGWSEAEKRAYVIADNKLTENAGWDPDTLKIELEELRDEGFDMDLVGFNEQELQDLFGEGEDEKSGGGSEDDTPPPEPPPDPVTIPGDVWQLGRHRIMCGDSLDAGHVAKLMEGASLAALIHADPPYGMGKASQGVENDNLYQERLDEFQLRWWLVWREYAHTNASAYIWGNSEDLWRLWFVAGLRDVEHYELRNEIVWDKGSIPGMASDLLTQYPIASERCLFIQFGKQFLGNINKDDFPEEWAPLQEYLRAEADAAGLNARRLREITGLQMFGHWFSRSQFALIPREHYQKIQRAFPEHFQRPWDELNREWDTVRGRRSDVVQDYLSGARSYFDNAHEIMRDVWQFPRVVNEERYGHATPKPVAMIERAVKSSAPEGGVVMEPFAGTGTTLMACETTGRVCYTMELTPAYVDSTVQRWEKLTGKKATKVGDGRSFAEIKNAREDGSNVGEVTETEKSES